MVPLTHLEGRSIGVFGLARSGLATRARGGRRRRRRRHRLGRQAGGARQGGGAWRRRRFRLSTGRGSGSKAWSLRPACRSRIPSRIPSCELAKGAGVEIVCDIELLWRELNGYARFVAVTGTNGKSTTTALLGHVLAVAGPVSVGGNIGRAGARPRAARREADLRARNVVLPARSDAALPPRRRDLAEPHARPPRTPRRSARLCRAKARVFVNMRPGGHGHRRHRRAADERRRRGAEEPRPPEARHRLGRQEQGRQPLRRRERVAA